MADPPTPQIGYGGNAPSPALPSPPTQRRGERKRERIYAVAIARFGEHGVEGVTVEDVIEEAEVSWATFYRYFPRKEDVLIEAASRHFRAHVRPEVEAGIADGRRRIRRTLEATSVALTTPVELPGALHAAMLLEVFANPGRFAAVLADGGDRPMVALVADLLAEGQRRGEVRDDVAAGVLALTVVPGTIFPAVQAAAGGGDPTASLKVAVEILWAGVKGG